jgi:hypothetical protein
LNVVIDGADAGSASDGVVTTVELGTDVVVATDVGDVASGSGTVTSTDAAGGTTAAEALDSFGPLSRMFVFTAAAAEPAASTPTIERAVAIFGVMVVPPVRSGPVVGVARRRAVGLRSSP